MGYIQTTDYLTTKLSAVNETLNFRLAEPQDTDLKPGRTYITAEGLYGQQIELERPGVAESADVEFIKQMLFEDIISNVGTPISLEQRTEILQNYIDVNQEKPDYKADEARIHIIKGCIDRDWETAFV